MDITKDTRLPELLTAKEVARLMAAGERTISRWSQSGVMPAPLHVGGAVRFRREQILAWIKAGCPRIDEQRDQISTVPGETQ